VQDGYVHLQIQDDGRGFDPENMSKNALEFQRLGLLGIRERAERLGGRARIDSAPGKGTSLAVTIPLGGNDAEDPHPAG
jgi:signal transduction histidine kinase